MWFPIYLRLLTDSVLNITELMKIGEQMDLIFQVVSLQRGILAAKKV